MRCRSAFAPRLLIAALVLASAGCCCQQGYVLHGDWSLRLCRAPCAAPACASDCCPAGCGDSQCPGGRSSSRQGHDQAAGQGAGQSSGDCADGPLCKKCGNCRHHCRCKRRGGSATAANSPTGPAMGHPRFHPVPVRPVFGPVVSTQLPVPTAQPEPADPLGNEPEEVSPPQPYLPDHVRRRVPARRGTVQQAAGYSSPGPM